MAAKDSPVTDSATAAVAPAPAPAAAAAPGPLTRAQAIIEWHDATTADQQRAIVEKFKGDPKTDLRHIYADAGRLGVL